MLLQPRGSFRARLFFDKIDAYHQTVTRSLMEANGDLGSTGLQVGHVYTILRAVCLPNVV